MENGGLGQIQIKIDEKGRFSLPGSSLEGLSSQDLVLVTSVFQKTPYLEVLEPSVWEKRLAQISQLPAKDPKTRAYKRFFLSGSFKLSLDKQNRVTLPPFQRNFLGLDRKGVIVNLESGFELWAAEAWEKVQDNFISSFEDLENWVNEMTSEEEQVGLESAA